MRLWDRMKAPQLELLDASTPPDPSPGPAEASTGPDLSTIESLGTYAAAWCDLFDPVQGVASDPQSWRKRGLGNGTNPATIAQAIV